MNLRYITGETWADFQVKHPSAYQFLLHESLLQEKRSIQKELDRLNAMPDFLRNKRDKDKEYWLKQRLAELNYIEPL